ncbi:MAG: hypothetical protein KF797_03440 [Flavobacteriales bacterium]|nr:hypothetical protein [Flavobacteriales bacterium]
MTLIIMGCHEQRGTGGSPRNIDDTLPNDLGQDATAPFTADTLFLLRDTTGPYHAIYIEKDRSSSYYRWLTDFSFREEESAAYRETLEHLTSNVERRHFSIDLPRYWLPLYRHGDHFFLYAPSDHGNARKRIINDSTFVFWYMDGPFPRPILGMRRRPGPNTIELDLLSMNEQKPSDTMLIHMLDTTPTMVVFEFVGEPEPHRYQLYTPVESANRFDLVVNHSAQKQREYEFDAINYAELLKGR